MVVTAKEAKLKPEWVNRTRCMVMCSRGTDARGRHLMNDLRTLMPHSKAESKFDKKEKLTSLNEICEMRNCDKTLYFEARKKKDLYLWATAIPRGPTVKFLVQNIHTMQELKLTGNCLKGSRPILTFTGGFDDQPHLQLVRELLTQIFSTPNQHPQSQPFIDHVLSFSLFDGRIWFRNFEIKHGENRLEEIGPRFVMQLICILDGSFGGPLLFENPEYISPNIKRREERNAKSARYEERVGARVAARENAAALATVEMGDPTDDIFAGDAPALSYSQQNRLKRKIDRKQRKTKKPKTGDDES